jgi:hypothetical protein
LRKIFRLLHTFANVDQRLIKGMKPDQPCAWIFNVNDDVYDNYRDNGKTQNMQPAPVLASCHAVSSQQRANETEDK